MVTSNWSLFTGERLSILKETKKKKNENQSRYGDAHTNKRCEREKMTSQRKVFSGYYHFIRQVIPS